MITHKKKWVIIPVINKRKNFYSNVFDTAKKQIPSSEDSVRSSSGGQVVKQLHR